MRKASPLALPKNPARVVTTSQQTFIVPRWAPMTTDTDLTLRNRIARLLERASAAGAAIPLPFLVVLIFWLAILFASFSLFADNKATTVVAFAFLRFRPLLRSF